VSEGIRLTLLFFSLGGVRFACDADHAEALSAVGAAEEGAFRLDLALGYPSPVSYREPTVLTLKGEGERRVVIDALEQIAEVGLEEIRPLPALLEPLALKRGIWGVLPRAGALVLLLDLDLLMKQRPFGNVSNDA